LKTVSYKQPTSLVYDRVTLKRDLAAFNSFKGLLVVKVDLTSLTYWLCEYQRSPSLHILWVQLPPSS